MGLVACNAIEFGLIFCCGNPNGVFRSRVSKQSILKIENRNSLKCLWRQGDFSIEKREWLIASNHSDSIATVAGEAKVWYRRIQFRRIIGSMSVVAESARYIDRFMNVLAGEFEELQLFKRLWRQAHETVKEREGLAALNYFLRIRTMAGNAEVVRRDPQLLRKLRGMRIVTYKAGFLCGLMNIF